MCNGDGGQRRHDFHRSSARVFGVLGLTFVGFFAVAAVLQLLTALRLKARRSRRLCLVTAGLTCMEMPYGTALGVFTFIVLDRPSVRRQFVD